MRRRPAARRGRPPPGPAATLFLATTTAHPMTTSSPRAMIRPSMHSHAPGQPRSVLLTPMPQIEVRDGTVTLSYFAGGRPIAMVEASGRTLYPITDHLGSTRAVIDDQGHLVARYTYRPFGRRATEMDDAAVTRLFTGAPANRASNLLLMGSRHYEPELGRLLEPDMVVPDPAEPLALNRHPQARDQ